MTKLCDRGTLLISITLLITMLVIVVAVMPPATDWSWHFWPAARAMVRGESPYDTKGIYNPPWAIGLLIPIAVFPLEISRAILLMISIASVVYLAYQLGGSRLTIVLFTLSSPVLLMLWMGNIDWLALLGLLLPPPVGVVFLAIKPQATIGVFLYWAALSWRQSGLLGIIKTFWLLGAALTLSFLLYGFWPSLLSDVPNVPWNESTWPSCVPLGIILVAYSIYKRDIRFAAAASPFLTPYVMQYSRCVLLLPCLGSPVFMSLGIIALWIGGLLR